MPRLSAFQETDIKPVAVDLHGTELHFDIDMNAFTIGWQKRMNAAAKSGDIGAVAVEFFSLVKKWDITDDKDKVLPLDERAFDQLSISTFGSLSRLITEALDPNDFAPAT